MRKVPHDFDGIEAMTSTERHDEGNNGEETLGGGRALWKQ